MAIKGLTLSSTLNYVSDMDPGKTDPSAAPTTFLLAPVDVFVKAHLFDRGVDFNTGDSPTRINMNQMNLDYVRFGCKGIEGFTDAEGKPIPFSTGTRFVAGREYTCLSDSIIARFDPDLVRELAGQVRDMSVVTQAEAKNS